jgi:signal transduction histidine kinase
MKAWEMPLASNALIMDPRTNRFLKDFSAAGREHLVDRVVYQKLDGGEYLFHEGDAAEGICLVLAGEIEIVKASGTSEKVLALFGPEEYLGEIAVLDGQGRSTDARAKGPASIAWIPTADLLQTLVTEPVAVTLQLFQTVLAAMRRTNELYVDEVVRKQKLSLIGEMSSSLMHDLRNPLSGIRLASELITMIHSDEETTSCCDKIRLQCDRVVAMAGELLEFSRGETKLNLAPTDTDALLDQFIAFNEDSYQRKGVNVNVEHEPAEIEVDSMRLLRVLQNLVSNAVDVVKGKPDGLINVQAWVSDAVLHLVVRDNGSGIPDAIKETLFEPFVTHGKQGGTGLGLSIVLNVVTAHRGKITVETAAGEGTEFLIRIPQDSASPAVE